MATVVRFQRLQPIPPAHPRPDYPALPVIGRAGLAQDSFEPASRFLAPDAVFPTSGKAATHLALLDAGVRQGDEVIVPAYHCPTMVHPILALGARPIFVPIDSDTTVSTPSLSEAASSATRAVLLPHFFGFLQPGIDQIAAWCESRGITLIEDCAHAFYGAASGALPGTWGDYAIASTRKFFPGSEGGALVANGRGLALALGEARWRDEARGVYQIVEESIRYGAFPLFRGRAAEAAPVIGPPTERDSLDEAAPAPASPQDLESAACGRRALRSAVWLVRHADHVRIASVRRRRFLQWRDEVARLPRVEPFRSDFPSSQVPYIFPLRLLEPERQFRALKYAGITVWRWDHLAETACPVSARLAVELVQMPCQHSMGDEDFERLLARFRRVIESA